MNRQLLQAICLLLSLLFLSSCTETICFDDVPSPVTPSSTITVTGTNIAEIIPGVSPPQYFSGPQIASGNSVLIRVSGEVDVCNKCTGSNPQGCTQCGNSQDPGCSYGTPYAIPANSYYWVYTTVVPASSTLQLAVPPPNNNGVMLGSDCVSKGPANGNYTNCSCSDFGASIPATCTGPYDCGSMSCISSDSCQPTQYCNDLTIGNRWIENIKPYNMPYTPAFLGPQEWHAGGYGLQIQLGYYGPTGSITSTNKNDDSTVDGVFFINPANTPLQSSSGFLGGVYPNPVPNNPAGFTTQTITNNTDNDLPLYLRIVTQLFPGQKTQGENTVYYSFIGGYNVYIKSLGCLAYNGNPYMSSGKSLGGDLHIQLSPAPSVPQTTPPVTHSLSVFAPQQTQCGSLPESLQQYCNQSEIDNGIANYYFGENIAGFDAVLSFRVNPATDPSSNGKLNITTYTQVPAGLLSKIISALVIEVKDTLLGTGTSDGAAGLNFTNLTANASYIFYIRIILELYIILYGVMYLLGMIQVSQFDLVIRIVKIAVVVALITPNSWKFFRDNFFDLYINGSTSLVSIFTGSPNIFAFADDIANSLYFSKTVWLRVAQNLVSPTGIPLMIMMLWGMFYFGLALLECVVSYLLSIVTISVLLTLAPIFISFILFSKTKGLFDTWLKFLLSHSLIPVIMVIGLTILSSLLFDVIVNIFSNGVCFGCVIEFHLKFIQPVLDLIKPMINIDDPTICISYVKPFGYSPMGDGMSFTSAIGYDVINLLLFMLIIKAMDSLPVFVSDLVNRLTGVRDISLRAGLGGSGDRTMTVAKTIASKLKQGALSTVGMDDESRKRRANKAAEKHREGIK